MASKQLVIKELLKFWDAENSNGCTRQEECKPSNCDVDTSTHLESMKNHKIHQQNKIKMSDTGANVLHHLEKQINCEFRPEKDYPMKWKNILLTKRQPGKCDLGVASLDTMQNVEDCKVTDEVENETCLFEEKYFASNGNSNWISNGNSNGISNGNSNGNANGNGGNIEMKNITDESKLHSAPDILISALSKVNESLDDWHFLSGEDSSTDSERKDDISLENFDMNGRRVQIKAKMEDTNVAIIFNLAIFSLLFQLIEKIQKMIFFPFGLMQARFKKFHQMCLPVDEGSLQHQMMFGLFMTTGLSMIGLLASIIMLLQDIFF